MDQTIIILLSDGNKLYGVACTIDVFLGARFLELEEKVPGNRTTVVLFDLLHCKLGKWAQRSQRSAMISRQRVANARESVDDITQ